MAERPRENTNNAGKGQEQPTPGTSSQSEAKSGFLTPEQIAEVSAAWDMAVTKGLKGSIMAVPGRIVHVALWKPRT